MTQKTIEQLKKQLKDTEDMLNFWMGSASDEAIAKAKYSLGLKEVLRHVSMIELSETHERAKELSRHIIDNHEKWVKEAFRR